MGDVAPNRRLGMLASISLATLLGAACLRTREVDNEEQRCSRKESPSPRLLLLVAGVTACLLAAALLALTAVRAGICHRDGDSLLLGTMDLGATMALGIGGLVRWTSMPEPAIREFRIPLSLARHRLSPQPWKRRARGKVPKILYSFWMNKPDAATPAIVSFTLARLRNIMEQRGYRVHVLTPRDAAAIVPGAEELYNFFMEETIHREPGCTVGPSWMAAYTDWLRFRLLAATGGLWMDATVLINDPSYLDAIFAQVVGNPQVEMFAFNNPAFASPAAPITENSVLLAPAGSRFMIEWAMEFEHALFDIGIPRYCEIASRQLTPKQRFCLSSVHGGPKCYLSAYYAQGLVMLRRHARGKPFSHYGLARSALNLIWYQFRYAGQTSLIAHGIANQKLATAPPLVKITNLDRAAFERRPAYVTKLKLLYAGT